MACLKQPLAKRQPQGRVNRSVSGFWLSVFLGSDHLFSSGSENIEMHLIVNHIYEISKPG